MGFLQRGFAYGNRRGFGVSLDLLIEEQLSMPNISGCDVTDQQIWGQLLLSVAARKIVYLAFPLSKLGNPGGDIVFSVRMMSDKSILAQKYWGDMSTASVYPAFTWAEVKFDSPPLCNGDTIICFEVFGGDGGNQIIGWHDQAAPKPNEHTIRREVIAGWQQEVINDTTYRYKYYQM